MDRIKRIIKILRNTYLLNRANRFYNKGAYYMRKASEMYKKVL